jgi:DNA polymerase III subunit epsilon
LFLVGICCQEGLLVPIDYEISFPFCGFCGNQNQPSHNYCTECGKPLELNTETNSHAENIDNEQIIDEGERDRREEELNDFLGRVKTFKQTKTHDSNSSQNIIFLDTETTGLSGKSDKIIELAIVDYDGDVLFNELINPDRPINNSHIHRITNEMVAGCPSLDDYWSEIKLILMDKHIVIFNKNFDTKFFPDHLKCAGKVSCAMEQFKAFHRGRKYNLRYATEVVGYKWEGEAHRALADTLATRAVWLYMNSKSN